MPLTQFPNGISSFGMPIVGAGDETLTTGNVFFVDSGAANGSDNTSSGKDPIRPFSTIDYAVGQCTANNGDIIFVMPGHTESPATTDGIDIDVAGVWVRGIGWGDDRPKITPENALVGVHLAAAGTRISNLVFALGATTATVAAAIDVSAAGCIVENCETQVHATSQFTNLLNADSSAARLVVRNCNLRALHTASSSAGIILDGCDDITITGNTVMGHFGSAAALDNTTGSDEILRANISGNIFRNDSSTAGDLAVSLDDAATGMFANNMLSGGLATTAANYEIGDMASLESYIVDSSGVDVHGIVLGTAAV